MPDNTPNRRRKKRPQQNGASVLMPLILAVVLLAAAALVIRLCINLASGDGREKPTSAFRDDSQKTEDTEPSQTGEAGPLHVVSTATIAATGDVLMHMSVVNTGLQSDGSYNFDSIFQYLSAYSSAADLAVANLETTLCGTGSGYQYSSYPLFNTPDEIVDSLKKAGFDLLLTANNHSSDTTMVGYKRTLEVVKDKGLTTLGTQSSAADPKYTIQDLGGIRIGMLCYTYATTVTDDGRPSLNGNYPVDAGTCNFFHAEHMDTFYSQVDSQLKEMQAAGAEATVMFIHWGEEYQISANEEQKTIAQKLCDMGIDVIIGGHPHVVEPVALLTSNTDPDHKTVCLYSMGNAVSNQRLGNISRISTAHTEDGVLFSVTFEKYSDGSVYVSDAEVLPTWVNMKTDSSGTPTEYHILPLDYDRVDEWKTLYGLDDTTFSAAKDSYSRTMSIVGDGLTKCQTYLAQEKQAREGTVSEGPVPAAA